VHGLVVLFCETQRNDPMEIAEAIKRAVDESGVTDKPIAVSFIGGAEAGRSMQWLVEHGLPTYGAPDIAVNAIAALHEYARNASLAAETFTPRRDVDEAAARAVIAQARAAGRAISPKSSPSRYSPPTDCPSPSPTWRRRRTRRCNWPRRWATRWC
jgi:acetyltransferase